MSHNESIQELRCLNVVKKRDGTMGRCNAKLCEVENGSYVFARNNGIRITVQFGSIKCPRCGDTQIIPPSPLKDPIVLKQPKEAENVRRV